MKKQFLFLVSMSFFFCGYGQIYTPTKATVYGEHTNRNKPDSVQHLPEKTTTILNTKDSTAQIFLNKTDSSIWAYYRARGFFKVGSLNATDTTNKWINRIFRKPGKDSVFYTVGINTFAIKDSTGGGGGTPAGSDTWVQFNNLGVFGASSKFTTNSTIGSFNVDSLLNIRGGLIKLRVTGSGTVAIEAYPGGGISFGADAGLHAVKDAASTDFIFIGSQAGYNQHAGTRSNIFVGKVTGYSDTIGNSNVFLGNNIDTYDGNYNTIVGHESFQFGTDQVKNSVLGMRVLNAGTNASENVGIGYESMVVTTTGNKNVAVGNYTLDQNVTGSSNIAVGYAGGWDLVSPSNGLFFNNNLGNTNHIIVGFMASTTNKIGFNWPSSSYNSLHATADVNGDLAVQNITFAANKDTVLYQNPSTGVIQKTKITASITVGSTALGSGTTTRVIYDKAGVVGEDAGFTYDDAHDIVIADSAFTANKGKLNLTNNSTTYGDIYWGPTGSGNIHQKVDVNGNMFWGSGTKVADGGADGVFIGNLAGINHTSGNSDIGIGKQALGSDVSGTANVFICASCTITTGIDNTVTGSESIQNGTSAGHNSAYGYRDLNACTTCTYNSSYGGQAGESLVDATQNSLFGHYSGGLLIHGNGNVAFGFGSLFSAGDVSNQLSINNHYSNTNAMIIGNFASTTHKVGINLPEATTLTATLDINGNLRIRTITSSTAVDSILVNDGGVIKYTTGIVGSTFTTALTGITNYSSSSVSSNSCLYQQIGNIVGYSMSFSVTTSGAGATEFLFTLPVASDLASSIDLEGVGVSSASGAIVGQAVAEPTSNKGQFDFVAAAGTTYNITITGHYIIK